VSVARIRSATPSDAALVADLGRRTYLEHFEHLWSPPDLYEWLDGQFGAQVLAADLAAGGAHYDLLFADDVPMGYAKTRADRAVTSMAHLRGLELQKIYFLRAATNRGFGSLLLAHILERADAAGEPLVWLDVLQSNEGGRRLYERFGFRVVAENRGVADLAFFVMIRERG
jgi:ribosomal protein S18 acetylase RimI-like enzyme